MPAAEADGPHERAGMQTRRDRRTMMPVTTMEIAMHRAPARQKFAAALALGLGLGLALPAVAQEASRDDRPYSVDVWFDARVDAAGRLVELVPQDEQAQPAAFWAKLQSRLLGASVTPLQQGGQTVGLRSGLNVTLKVHKSETGGDIEIQQLKVSPLPVFRYYVGYPRDIRRAGWTGAVAVSCTVGVEGRCQPRSLEVEALPGMPDSVRRWAKATLEAWRFQPQEVDGQPIEGQYRLAVKLYTRENMPKNFREPRRL